MPKVLSAAQVAAYERDGYVFPIDALSASEAIEVRREFDALRMREGGKLSGRTNSKPHLLLPWLSDLVRHPRILDAVEDIFGPNILCWAAGFFAKGPGDGKYVSWHQDSTYWGLSSPDVMTVWLAFSASTVEAGAMRVIPGTHKLDQIPHKDTHAADNLLSRGQEVAVDVDPSKAVDLVLKPGQMSLHHVRLIHGSEPNRSKDWRIGYTIRYVPTHVKQISGPRDSATLVRGVDTYGHFELEPRPKRDYDPDCVAFHGRVFEQTTQFLYKGSAKPRVAAPVKT
jgi:hypothetical protein